MKTQSEIMHEAGFFSAGEVVSIIGAKDVSAVHRMVKRGVLIAEKTAGSHWYISAASLLTANAGSPTILERIRKTAGELGVPLTQKEPRNVD